MKIPRPRIQVITLFVVMAVSILILIFLYGVTYKQINASLRTSQNLMHSGQVAFAIEKLVTEVQNVETSQRGFLLTRDSAYLKPLQNGKQRINASFASLELLLYDDPTQLRNLKILRQQVNKRFTMLIENIARADTNLTISLNLKHRIEIGHKLMQSSMDITNRMLAYQDNYLLSMRKKHYDAIVSTPIIYFSIVLISLTIFVFLILKLNADRKKLQRTVAELSVTNHSFEQAEQLAGLGYWRHNYKDGSNIFSDNYFNMLGIKRGEQGTTFRHLVKLVYPPDREMVIEALKDAFRHSKPFEVTYRIQPADGRIKHIKSIGKTVSDPSMQRFLIGINMDVTELVVNSKLLELKNSRLELFNSDLASFNYVASHDLQAPLRKIQMFISRIIETDELNLSEKGAEYLQRMHTSAAQMQLLINDLLMFSRTTSGHKKFETTDLNVLLKNAIDELALPFEETKASIISEELPVISVIPYQVQQLFINLISNSLKFAQAGVKPVIRVDYHLIDMGIFGPDDLPVNEKFHMISFTDNGIGFEKEYAQKIFNLLFRLHDKSVYPGSGIGLAICKKIVENHNGFIEAQSQPGKGATFNVYFPVNINSKNLF